MSHAPAQPRTITATIAGVPRIGPRRELKRALEMYWMDPTKGHALATTATRLTNTYCDELTDAGLDSIPTAGRSYYDAVLDTQALLGVLPERFDAIPDHDNDGLPRDVDRLFATARGTAEIPAATMTKWFDTNYHYIVPELTAGTQFRLDADAFLTDIAAQVTRGTVARPVLIGPLTFLSLAKTTDGSDPLDHLEDVFAAYGRLLPRLAQALQPKAALGSKSKRTELPWVQFDEPTLVTDCEPYLDRVRAGYAALAAQGCARLLVQTYFGDGDRAVRALSGIGLGAIGVDLTRPADRALPSWDGSTPLLAGVVDGRNVWRTDLAQALATLRDLQARGPVGVSTSCSLLHVPYSLAQESSLDQDPELRSWLAFGAEKITEVAALARLLRGTPIAADLELLAESKRAAASRRSSHRTHDPAVRARAAAITAADRHRAPYA